MTDPKPIEGDVAEVPNSSDAEVNDDDDEGFVVFESPQQVIENLQSEINQKDDEIRHLEKKLQSLYLEFDNEVKAKEQRAQELQESLDSKCHNVVRYCKQVEDLEAAFKTEQKNNQEMQKTLEQKLQSAFADKEDVVHELNVAKNHLESLELTKINLELKLKDLQLRLKNVAEVYKTKYLTSSASSYSGPAFDPPPTQTVSSETTADETQVADVPSVLESSTEVPTVAAPGITADDVPSVSASAGEEEASVDKDIGCLPCSICHEEIVCNNRDMRQMAEKEHLEKEHKQFVCPVKDCWLRFDKNIPGIDSKFHLHVEAHFSCL